jgi:hypothetical protein
MMDKDVLYLLSYPVAKLQGTVSQIPIEKNFNQKMYGEQPKHVTRKEESTHGHASVSKQTNAQLCLMK